MMRLNRFFRNKKTGNFSNNLVDVLGKELTIRTNLGEDICSKKKTVFKEIEVIPPLETLSEEYKELIKVKANCIFLTWPKFVERLYTLLIRAVEKEWSKEKTHLVYHSSGYDSRIMSMIIKELSKKHGIDWLGDILFVCKEPEGDTFEKIMDYQGWDRKQYRVYNKGVPKGDYYKLAFDYSFHWKQANGCSERPVNVKYVPLFDLQMQKILPSDNNIQMWSNQFAEILSGKHISFSEYYTKFYYTRFSRFWSAVPCEVVDLYLDFDVVKFLIEATSDKWASRDLLREELMLLVDPNILKFKRWTWKDVYNSNFFTLSNELYNKALKDFETSWYFKNTNLNIKKTKSYMKKESFAWWAAWSMGSFSNYLSDNGYTLKVGDK